MNKYSTLTIIFSNCLGGGTAWNTIESKLIENLRSELSFIDGLEFRDVNSNTVRGEHNSFTLAVSGAFYNLSSGPKRESASKLLEHIRNAANRVTEMTYSEIRIEFTKTFSIFR